MKHIKYACLAVLLIGISACAHQNTNQEDNLLEEDVIALENLQTREVVYCYDSVQMSIEECAKYMENIGFMRLTDIPKFTADRNVLTSGTYPTRRWRETDRIPRW